MADHEVQFVRRAGNLILDLLTAASSIRYSQFYGPALGQEEWLASELFETEDELVQNDYLAPAIVDSAVNQLREFGLIETKKLSNKLMDDTRDYSIYLTTEGINALNHRDEIAFYNVFFD